MDPRNPSSTKWTAFPPEFANQVLEVLNEKFEDQKESGRFIFDGRIYPAELLLRLGYLEHGRLRQVNIDLSLDFESDKQNALQLVHDALSLAGDLFEQYFDAEGDEELMDDLHWPHYWSPVQFEKMTYYFQYNSENTDLEAEANRLLGIETSEMVNELELSEDALAMAEVNSELAKEIQKKIRSSEHYN